ncbi:tetratricopeptide repeat protein [Lentzea sp. NBRC 102530]|uniref:ATP-binding protein n=1 Tax=Lentzea sp. NBRC 102530 TaxID=3032201 RepID=UPI0024A1F5E8|nr:tetratricopeptide repeat protein [Lentzea sp. NBRC 102530]GLY50898.1 SARP family transcriptional regulator [Lentzea sp. NBRC 102530]
MEIAFRILGRTRVRVDGEFVADWGKPKARAVLAVLLLNAGNAISVNTIADWVWADRRPANLYPTVQTAITSVRAALQRTGVRFALRNEDRSYRLEIDRSLIDLHVFRKLVDRARAIGGTDHRAACELVEQALELWGDEPLADLEGELASRRRQHLVRTYYLTASHALLYGLGKLGDYARMLEHLDEIPPEHDLEILLAKHRLTALYGLRRAQEALNYLVTIRRRIVNEIGDGSEVDLNSLHERLRVRHEQSAVTRSPGPRYLPHDVDVFVGREDLLSELDALVLPGTAPRLITLDGQPGMGKTTLAVHWAHRVQRRFPDGCWFASHTDGGEVVADLLVALGVPIEPIQSVPARVARLREELASRRMLLVLDDVTGVEPLLPALSTSVVLVASRARMSSLVLQHRARAFTVLPLGNDEIAHWLTTLLGDRAAVAPEVVARLAERTGGMPLVMQLMAEQIAAQPDRSLADLVPMLSDGRTLLSLQGNNVRVHFERSYDALNPAQARLFRLFGLHPSHEVPLLVVAALAGLPVERARVLVDELVWKRLVETVDGGRCRTHDLLREFAADRLAQDEPAEEQDAAVTRLMSWYLHSVNNADRLVFGYRDEVPMLPLPDGVHPAEFADEDDVARWIAKDKASIVGVLRSSPQPGYVWRIANGAGELFLRYGHYEEVVAVMTAGAEAARANGDVHAETDTNSNLAHFFIERRDYSAAERLLERAQRVFGDRDDPETLAVLLRNKADCIRGADGVPRALELYQEALALAEGFEDTRSGILHRMGAACRVGGRLDEAAVHLVQARLIRQRTGDYKGEADSLVELAWLARESGDDFSARTNCHEAHARYAQAHHQPGRAAAMVLLGLIARDNDDPALALTYATEALELCTGLDRELEARAHDLLGQLAWKAGQHDTSIEHLEQAYRAFRDIGDDRARSVAAQLDEHVAQSGPVLPSSRSESTGIWFESGLLE